MNSKTFEDAAPEAHSVVWSVSTWSQTVVTP